MVSSYRCDVDTAGPVDSDLVLRPPRRRPWLVFAAIGMAIPLCGIAWLTLVGYDTTVRAHLEGGPMPAQHAACTWAVVVDGRMYRNPGRDGTYDGGLPPGDRVEVHWQLFQPIRMTFLAADGQRIALHPGGYVCGVQ